MAQDGRMNRRLVNACSVRICELAFGRVADPRKREGTWNLSTLLKAPLLGLVCGCKNLQETEELTENLTKPVMKRVGVKKRVPDTTMRDVLVEIEPDALRPVLWMQNKLAIRRKAIKPEGFPFGVVSMDGRGTATTKTCDRYAQTHHPQDKDPYGLVRTITSTLVSARSKPCLDMHPISPDTNEMGEFKRAFMQLTEVYSEELFQLVTYDSGACSKENGRFVEERNRAYLFRLKEGDQPTLYTEAERVLGRLGPKQAEAVTIDKVGKNTVTRRIWITAEMAGWHDWDHLRTAMRLESETVDEQGDVIALEQRYYISSLRTARLTARQWLQLARMHWGVENNTNGASKVMWRSGRNVRFSLMSRPLFAT